MRPPFYYLHLLSLVRDPPPKFNSHGITHISKFLNLVSCGNQHKFKFEEDLYCAENKENYKKVK
ncbi:hypothetical protein V2J09_014682 [Rumex salicifolius]